MALAGNNPRDEIFKIVHPVLLKIICLGVMKSSAVRLTFHALVSIALIPISFIIALTKKGLRLLVLILTWVALFSMLEIVTSTATILLVLSFLIIYIEDIELLLKELIVNLSIVITGGFSLRWICKGYLSSYGFRHRVLYSHVFEQILGGFSQSLPRKYQIKYSEVWELFQKTQSNNDIAELTEKLKKIGLDEYMSNATTLTH